MNSIITGGAGFIGSHLTGKLLEMGGNITIYDNFSSGKRDHIPNSSRIKVVEGDLKDLDKLTNAMRGSQQVFHLAANPDISKAVTQPSIDFWEGTLLCQNVLEAMRLNKVERIFYTSGSGVYGDKPETNFTENYGPCIPISTYGASKLACEALVAAYVHMFKIRATIFRFANVVGPRQTHGVGYDFVRQLAKNPKLLNVLGDGSQSKSYIYIEDVLNAIWHTFNQSEEHNLFNVGTGDYITVSTIAEMAKELCGSQATQLVYTQENRGWKGDVPIIRFDCSKIKKLGWTNKYNSEEAIKRSMGAMFTELTSKKA